MNIFVTSPLPLPMDRFPDWKNASQMYDSGVMQTFTTFVEALYKYTFSVRNMPRQKQSSLHAFWNQQKGGTVPFLLKDPYDFSLYQTINSGTTIAANSGFYSAKSSGFRVIVDSTAIRITSALSGTLSQGSHWVVSMDNGFVKMVIGKAAADTITVSADYFRKVIFSSYNEQSFLWNSFNGGFSIQEMVVL